MSHNGRRILYHPQYVRGFANALREARADLDDAHCRHRDELATLRAEVGELRDVVADVVHVMRESAERDVATLRHELELALVRLTRRNPATPLH